MGLFGKKVNDPMDEIIKNNNENLKVEQESLNKKKEEVINQIKKIPINSNQISNKGLNFIKQFEQYRGEAYMPTPQDRPTIGYGHTKGVKMGMKLKDEKEGVQLLSEDLKSAENAVRKLVKVDLTQHQRDALISLTFNIGEGNFKKSTLLKRINNKEWDKAATEFRKWTRQKGKVLKGLVRRREGEIKMFEGK